MRVMVLAVGCGERMRPLTDSVPKVLLKVQGLPIIVHQILSLAENGFKEIVINVSYLADKIIEKLGDGKEYGVSIIYSLEKSALETGGRIKNALSLLGTAPFLVVSGDIITNYPYQRLTTQLENLGHLVLVDNPSYHPDGDFHLAEGQLYPSKGTRLTYGNIAVLDPRLFEGISKDNFRLATLLHSAVDKGELSGEYFYGEWHNVGTPEELAAM